MGQNKYSEEITQIVSKPLSKKLEEKGFKKITEVGAERRVIKIPTDLIPRVDRNPLIFTEDRGYAELIILDKAELNSSYLPGRTYVIYQKKE